MLSKIQDWTWRNLFFNLIVLLNFLFICLLVRSSLSIFLNIILLWLGQPWLHSIIILVGCFPCRVRSPYFKHLHKHLPETPLKATTKRILERHKLNILFKWLSKEQTLFCSPHCSVSEILTWIDASFSSYIAQNIIRVYMHMKAQYFHLL